MAQRTEAQKAKMRASQQARRAREREAPAVAESLPLLRDIPDSLTEAIIGRDLRIHDLEEEIRQLKRQLAAKAIRMPPERGDVGRGDLAHLPKQDRDFFERKLGVKK